MAAGAEAAPNLEFSIGICSAKPNAKERLACYDAIAQRLRAGEAVAAPVAAVPAAPAPVAVAPAVAPVAPAPVAAAPVAPAPVAAAPVPAAAPAAAPEAQFGAEALKKETRAATGQPEPLDEIHGVIAKLAFSPIGRAIVTLDNGQVWRQVEGDTDHFKGKQGETATVARALLGSYNLTVEGRNQMIKVQRVR
jgi:hypothetical protein